MTITTISNSVGHGIKLGSGNYGLTLTVASTGAVHGGNYGVYGPSLSSAEALVNEGQITATEDGIFLDMPASLLNAGIISGGDLGAVMLGYIPNGFHTGGKDYFTNTGRISGGTYGAYFMYVTASNAGTITGGKTGVRMQGDSLVNSNSISGGTIGIFANEGIVINTGSGHISSQGIGVFVAYDSGPTPVISNAGNIYGGNTGAYIKFGTITNAGTIGAGTVGVWLTASNGSNSGLVYGTTIGVYLYGSADGPEQSFTNNVSGIIESAAGVGLSANKERYVLNMGVIAGKLAGAYVYDSSLTNFNIINGGSIGLAASNAAVTDYSEIIGGSFAIEATGSFLLSLANTALLDGNVLDEAGTGVLMLGGDGPGTLSGFGTTIIGFSKIGFAADWTLQGNAAGLAAGQVINGFTTADFLILDGFAATSGSLGAAGLILSNGLTTETIDLATIPVISDLSISSNGVSTTIAFEQPLVPISIISTFEPATLTPGENGIANSLTITSTGYAAGIKTDFMTHETVTNYGSINNVNFNRYSTLFNFGAIAGTIGVYSSGFDTFTNAGTIIGTGGNGVGVRLGFFDTFDNSGKITSAGTAVYSQAMAYLINTGTIAGNVNFGGDIDNAGVISGGSTFGISGPGADIRNAGTITGPEIGIGERFGGIIDNTGTIAASAYGISLAGATIIDSGLIAGATDAIFNADRDPYSGFFYTLSLEIDPGAAIAGAVVDLSNAGTLSLGGSTAGALDMGTSFSGFSKISFDPGSDWRLEGAASDLAGGQLITGFSAADTIILDNFVVNTLDTTYVTGSGLRLTSTSGGHVTLDIAGSFTTGDFIVTDPPGETTIELAVCYLRGTRIATPAGDIPVEALNIGDTVITRFNGYRKIKWIGRQNFASRRDAKNVSQIPVRISSGALGGGLPRRDLFISPGHSMLIDGVLVLAKSMINGITITQSQAPGEIHYYQLEFETHDCVLAEGAWSESYADTPDLRARFHNVAEFYTLYPDHREPETQLLCAPRPLAGPALAAVLLPLVQRAAAPPGRLHGYIDSCSGATIRGWAWDEANPHLPVQLEILLQDRIISRILACDHRRDLAHFGSGRCGFEFLSPLGLPPDAARHLRIRRAQDGAELLLPASANTVSGALRPFFPFDTGCDSRF